MRQLNALMLTLVLVLVNSLGMAADNSSPGKLKRVTQTLVSPPFLPTHDQVAKDGPKIVQVRLVVKEQLMDIAKGVTVQAMTFNGSVPGPIIVVHQNDYVELTLVNPKTNTLVHNIDFHAATGAMGGGDLTQVLPGQETVLRFKAIKAGVFIYHCAPGGVWSHGTSCPA